MFSNISQTKQKVLVRLSLVINLFLLLYLTFNIGLEIDVPQKIAYRRNILNQYFTEGEAAVKEPLKEKQSEFNKTEENSSQASESSQVSESSSSWSINLLSNPSYSVSPNVFCNNNDMDFHQGLRTKYWILYNYVNAIKQFNCNETITYTTHGDFTFLDNLEPLLERWQGPISVAVYAPGTDFEDTIDSILYFRDCTKSSLVKDYASFHVFFDTAHTPEQVPKHHTLLNKRPNCDLPEGLSNKNFTSYKKLKKLDYPVNIARNVARQTVSTHFVFPSDIELYPSPGIIPAFLDMIRRNDDYLRSSNPMVFVNSIFEIAANHSLPNNKSELIRLLKKGDVIPFHKHVCPQCHKIPHSKEWLKEKGIKTGMNVIHTGKRVAPYKHWEPIYIGTNAEPLYDERLSWEGRADKMIQGYKLCVLDYNFQILDNAFLIHRPGIKTKKTLKTDINNKKIGAQNNLIRKVIFPEIKKLYGTRKGCELF